MATPPKKKTGRKPTCVCGECKKCKHAAYMREWYHRKTDEEKRAWIARRDQGRVRRADKDRYENNPARREAIFAASAEFRKNNPDVRRAQNAVAKALKAGRLTKGECALSDDTCYGRVEAHHDDYNKPLEVRWLCRSHHSRHHHEHGPGARAKEEA